MATFRSFLDGLANALTGAGTSADRRKHAFWTLQVADRHQIEAAYRSSWLARKAVDLPPQDMTRQWRDWQAQAPQIEALEAEEKRLDIRGKVRRAMTFGRLGGGALILGVPGDPALPLNARTIGKGGLRYLHVVNRWQIEISEIETDPDSEWFGQPRRFVLPMRSGQRLALHPSRVVCFPGVPGSGLLTGGTSAEEFWGDSILQIIADAIQNAEMASNGFASLIDRASIDTIKIPELGAYVSTAEGEARLIKRLDLLAQAASSHRARIVDALEEVDHQQVTWTGMPDIIRTYLAVVAGATDIPATRLLGKAPDGMNATGDGDLVNYYDMLAGKQAMELAPALERIDAALIPSALGNRPADVYWSFAPLWQMSEKDAATVMKTKAEAVQIYVNSGLIPDAALSKAVANLIIEDGMLPGFEAALEEAAAEMEAEASLDVDEDDDPSMTAEERTARARRNVADATPKTLYVRRDVLNAAEIAAWARGQGFTDIVTDMHVTLIASRTPVDWIKMGTPWSGEDGELVIGKGGPRVVEPLGKAAAVLLFASTDLQWRHMAMREAGATSDFPDYIPHVTITYTAGPDLARVEPYRGRIVLGPEIFEEFQENPYG